MDRRTEEGDWRTGVPVTLSFPVPLSQNAKTRLLKGRGGRGYYTKQKNAAIRAAWYRAVSQCRPPAEPLEHCRIEAHFRLHNLRDTDKLGAGLEWIMDALKGAYFVDDDPRHVLLVTTQVIERDRQKQGVTLTITPS